MTEAEFLTEENKSDYGFEWGIGPQKDILFLRVTCSLNYGQLHDVKKGLETLWKIWN
jgi:hypothetical protein